MPASRFPSQYAALAWCDAGRWRRPAEVGAALEAARLRNAAVLLSDGGPQGRWSYVLAEPDERQAIETGSPADFDALRGLLGTRLAASDPALPPFTGGVLGLAAYDLGDGRSSDWPALILHRHGAVLAFDHHRHRVLAIGRGRDKAAAEIARAEALGWCALPPVADLPFPATALISDAPDSTYLTAVRDVIDRIGRGDLYQANVARAWTGVFRGQPLAVFQRLAAASPAPFAAWLDLGERQLVSNSPELFLRLDPSGRIIARPIKGTRPRGPDPGADAAHAAELRTSVKDRAENLMIVDLMRNDLAQVADAGSVSVPALFEVETYPNVHHLVSTVEARLAEGRDASDLMAASFPPGSITGAPKAMAMTIIAGHEPARGPWCGSLFLAGFDGGLIASVLIRTLAFHREGTGWRLRTQAGAGIVADSDPQGELAETEAKIAAIRRALGG